MTYLRRSLLLHSLCGEEGAQKQSCRQYLYLKFYFSHILSKTLSWRNENAVRIVLRHTSYTCIRQHHPYHRLIPFLVLKNYARWQCLPTSKWSRTRRSCTCASGSTTRMTGWSSVTFFSARIRRNIGLARKIWANIKKKYFVNWYDNGKLKFWLLYTADPRRHTVAAYRISADLRPNHKNLVTSAFKSYQLIIDRN
jgi:hypothetical protein